MGARQCRARTFFLVSLGLAAAVSPAAARTALVQDTLPTFKWAVFAHNSLTMGGTGSLTDGYDSRNGPYNAATADSTGDLASNANIDLQGGALVKGDVTAVSTVTVASTASVTGTITQGAPPFPTMPVLTCPRNGYTPAASVPNGPGVSYSASSGQLSVSGGNNLTLNAPPTQYYLSKLTLSGGSTITINGGGQRVDIFIDDQVSVSGGGVLNTGTSPTSLALWACGSKTTKWTFTGGSGAYFTIYAPNHPVRVDDSELWGAVVGDKVEIVRGSKIHYDLALTVPVLRQPDTPVTVSPDATASRLPSNGTSYTVAFTVQNIGGVTQSYDLLTTRRPGTVLSVLSITGSGVTQGANPDSARVANLAAGAAVPVTVSYSVGNVAAGATDTLFLTARAVGSPADSDNARLRLAVVRPNLTTTRTVSPSTTQAPGTDLTYSLGLTNTGTSDAAGVVVVDTLAAAAQLKVGSVATTLPAGVAAVVEYSKDGGVTWTYVPASGACGGPAGYDRCVNRIRWRLQQPLSSAAPNNAGTLQFVAQIR